MRFVALMSSATVVLLAVGCGIEAPNPAAPSARGVMRSSAIAAANRPSPVRLGFDALTADGSSFTIDRESDFTVSALSGNWIVKTTVGHPAPFIWFVRLAAESVLSAEVVIKADAPATAVGGPAFHFTSVDLYSSLTAIPYTFVGLRSSNVVFSESGTVPQTFGNFVTVANPSAGTEINALRITLSNPATPCCSNTVGLDNIVMMKPPAEGQPFQP
jgi:hypothetical protein